MTRLTTPLATLLGQGIRAGRTRRRLSLDDVARRAVLTPEQVEQLEAGRRRAGASELYRLCAALAIDARTLFQEPPVGDGNPSVPADDGDALGAEGVGDPVGKPDP